MKNLLAESSVEGDLEEVHDDLDEQLSDKATLSEEYRTAIQAELLEVQTELDGASEVEDLLEEVEVMNMILRSFWEAEDLHPNLAKELANIIDDAKLALSLSTELRRIFGQAEPTEYIKSELQTLISKIKTFLAKDEFKSVSTSMMEKVVYLSLKEVILDQKTYTNIEILFEKKLKLIKDNQVNDKEKQGDIVSPKLKYIPFKPFQEVVNEFCRKAPGIGKFFVEGYPVKISKFVFFVKLSLQASGDIAFFSNKVE